MTRVVTMMILLLVFLIPQPSNAQESSACHEPTGTAPPAFEYEFESSEDLGEIFSPQIVDYLHTTGSTEGMVEAIGELSDEDQPLIDAQVFEADLTGDGEVNVLVSVNVTWGAGYNNVLAVFGCVDNAYQTLSTLTSGDFFDIGGAPPTTIVSVADMNGNHRPEIAQRRGLVQQKYLEAVNIYEWNERELVEVFTTGFSLGYFDSVAVVDNDNDSETLELVIGDRWGYGQATAYAVIEIVRWRPIQVEYGWDGETYDLTCQFFTDDPTTRFETMHSAETHRACGHYDEAMERYQELLNNPDLAAWASAFALEPLEIEDMGAFAAELENAYVRAFSYYRLAQLHLLEGDVEAAQSMLEMAQAEFSVGEHGYQYVAMTEALVNHFNESNDLGEACNVAEMRYNEVRESGDDPGIPYFVVEYSDGMISQSPFYWDSGKINSSDPDDIFNVPASVSDMIQIPICIN